MKKACFYSSCSTVGTKKFKMIPMEEMLFSQITVLEWVTLPDNELLHRHFLTFLIAIVEWYKDLVSHYTIFLKFQGWHGKNGKNIIKGRYQKEGIKYERGGMILYNTHYSPHMFMIFFMWSSPLVHMSKWWLSLKDK